jgi:hypothetical protein
MQTILALLFHPTLTITYYNFTEIVAGNDRCMKIPNKYL